MDQADVRGMTASGMTSAASAKELRRLELNQVFCDTRTPIVEIPAVREALAASAERSAKAIMDVFGLDVSLSLHRAVQQTADEALAPCAGAVGAVYVVPEWGARAVVAFDRIFLFRALDTMCGGTGRIAGPVPARVLTALEQAVAGRLATAVMKEFQSGLAPLILFECVLESIEPVFDSALLGKDRCELVSVQMRVGDSDGVVTVALPARGVERARDLTTAPIEEGPLDLDPDWSRYLEVNVGRAEIDVIAVAEGPPMLLGDVGRLQQGSLIEFDAERLEYVRIVSDGEAIFEGRLGQSKGYLSICIEMPLAADAGNEAAVARGRHRVPLPPDQG
jgi:flagellar motor switch protein FliM